jgi:hypothetical protein
MTKIVNSVWECVFGVSALRLHRQIGSINALRV